MIRNSGFIVDIEIVKTFTEPASNRLATLLQIDPGDEVLVIERMYYADKNPAVLCRDYLPSAYIQEKIEPDEYAQSIFKILSSKCGKQVTWDKVELSTISIGEETALGKHFRTQSPEKSLLLCEAINYDEFSKPIFFASEYIDTKYIRFNIIRPKDVSYQ